MKFLRSETGWIPFALFALFLTAVVVRPPLPVDETRYLTVAWEMYLRGDWLAPLTLNGEPYHQKPPLLFWLINMCWGIFGVSRWAGTLPVALAGAGVVWLCAVLAKKIFPLVPGMARRAALLMTGSVAFLMYGTIIMFDMSLSFFALVALLGLVNFSQTKDWKWLGLMALGAGLGVLMKGPVAYLYVLPVMLLAPLWAADKNYGRWLLRALCVVVIAALPVLLWLYFVLRQSDEDFAFWLVWNQTAGRVSGNFNDAHNHPFYFYLKFLPVLVLPWAFFPAFWTKMCGLKTEIQSSSGLRFLACWFVPVLFAFMCISGKQPHYLVPLLPPVMILVAYLFRDVSFKAIGRVALGMVVLFISGQVIAGQTILKRYDLMPIVSYIHDHEDHDWAFAKNYHGEYGFVGRLHRTIDEIPPHEIDAWFKAHPQGMLIMNFRDPAEVAAYEQVMDIPYRGKRLGIFKAR